MVIRNYRFKNDRASNLGREPLPDGEVKAMRVVTDDLLWSYLGGTRFKYIPVNEQVDLELGNDSEILVKPTLMDWMKTDIQFDNQGNIKGWVIREAWQIETQNSKDIDVELDIRRSFRGDWALVTDAKYEKMDATKVKFLVSLKPREKKQFVYEVTTRHGTSATR
jgi:hypothetical protein